MMSVEQKQHAGARVLAVLALAALLCAYFLVALCLFHAARDGALSDLWAPSSGGNHGPWRHYAPARIFLDSSPLFVPPAVFLALMSQAVERSRLCNFTLIGSAAFTLNYLLFFWMMTD